MIPFKIRRFSNGYARKAMQDYETEFAAFNEQGAKSANSARRNYLSSMDKANFAIIDDTLSLV